MKNIETITSQISRMVLFNNIKTDNPLIDALLTTFILGFFSWLFSWIYENEVDSYFYYFSTDDVKSLFYKKNAVILEGKRSSTTSVFQNTMRVSSAYSDRFKALWHHIIENIENNNTIYKIKENHTNIQSVNPKNENEDFNVIKSCDIFMVFQNKQFSIDPDIWIKADFDNENAVNEKDKNIIKTDKITITVYSFKYSLSILKKYVDNITENYLASIKESRLNKKFIYSLDKLEKNKEREKDFDSWREDIFESTRNFNNIFFDGKPQIIEKIDFFLNNKKWYSEKGIPYTLGIGLHGPPGTGKTSFIKALANYTNRHIIVISLKMISTKQQLERLFFENTYNSNNSANSVSWDKKILVFEDIDCIGDIILERTSVQNKSNPIPDTNQLGQLLKAVCETSVSSCSTEQPITLDDILNLWDGIRETPGRILIISSNHYDKLDSALIRPGRIDITHKLNNASHNTIADIYLHLFGHSINTEKLAEIKADFYSPAELINIFVSHKTERDFMTRLLKNEKVI